MNMYLVPAAIGFAGVLFGSILTSLVQWWLQRNNIKAQHSLKYKGLLEKLMEDLLDLLDNYNEFALMVDGLVVDAARMRIDSELVTKYVYGNHDDNHVDDLFSQLGDIGAIEVDGRTPYASDTIALASRLLSSKTHTSRLRVRLTAIAITSGIEKLEELTRSDYVMGYELDKEQEWFGSVVRSCLETLSKEYRNQ